MTRAYRKSAATALSLLLLLTILFFLSNCATLGLDNNDEVAKTTAPDAVSGSQPYYPTDFKDLLIPAELTWNRDETMTIRTASFAGGILNFTGRVEVNSLSDFFIGSMAKNGWKLAGTIKSKNILLTFTKPHKTCMFKISETDFTMKTNVYVYITEDIAGGEAGGSR